MRLFSLAQFLCLLLGTVYSVRYKHQFGIRYLFKHLNEYASSIDGVGIIGQRNDCHVCSLVDVEQLLVIQSARAIDEHDAFHLLQFLDYITLCRQNIPRGF